MKMMENDYVDFLIDEALDEDEEEILMKELQANPQLSMNIRQSYRSCFRIFRCWSC